MPLPHSAWLLSGNSSIERVGEKREEVGNGVERDSGERRGAGGGGGGEGAVCVWGGGGGGGWSRTFTCTSWWVKQQDLQQLNGMQTPLENVCVQRILTRRCRLYQIQCFACAACESKRIS